MGQSTIFNGHFSLSEQKVGFQRGKNIIYNDGHESKNLTYEEFAQIILDNIPIESSASKPVGPRIKIILKA